MILLGGSVGNISRTIRNTKTLNRSSLIFFERILWPIQWYQTLTHFSSRRGFATIDQDQYEIKHKNAASENEPNCVRSMELVLLAVFLYFILLYHRVSLESKFFIQNSFFIFVGASEAWRTIFRVYVCEGESFGIDILNYQEFLFGGSISIRIENTLTLKNIYEIDNSNFINYVKCQVEINKI